MAKPEIDPMRLRELFIYDGKLGRLIWKVQRGKCRPRNLAGGENIWIRAGKCYRRVGVDGVTYWLHRVIWAHQFGYWPIDVDHRDGDGLNNQLKNLRECTDSQNLGNQQVAQHNRSGFKGVGWFKPKQKWRARIKFHQREYCLGYFHDPKVAHEAYLAKARELFGEFARAR